MIVLMCALAAGIAGGFAVVWWKERSWFVWLAIFPAAAVLAQVIGHLVAPH